MKQPTNAVLVVQICQTEFFINKLTIKQKNWVIDKVFFGESPARNRLSRSSFDFSVPVLQLSKYKRKEKPFFDTDFQQSDCGKKKKLSHRAGHPLLEEESKAMRTFSWHQLNQTRKIFHCIYCFCQRQRAASSLEV